jgi:hypothetical protein
MPEITLTAGSAIENDYIHFSSYVDEIGPDSGLSRLVFFDEQDSPEWHARDVGWKAVSVCTWWGGTVTERAYVALGSEGEVEIVGPNLTPTIREQIPRSSNVSPQLGELGQLLRIRQIGSSLYACGFGLAAYRRGSAIWERLPKQFTEKMDPFSFPFYADIAGRQETAVYAVGQTDFLQNGARRYSGLISFYDGVNWRTITDEIPARPLCIELSERYGVFIGATDGIVYYGDLQRGFEIAGQIPLTESRFDFTHCAEFDGKLFLGTSIGLYVLSRPGAEIKMLDNDAVADLENIVSIEARDGVLWVFCAKIIIRFDGTTWSRIKIPDNKPL